MSGSSVVPGLPNRISTPSCLRMSRKARFPDITGNVASCLCSPLSSRPLPPRGGSRPIGQRDIAENELGAQRQRDRSQQGYEGAEIELAAEHLVIGVEQLAEIDAEHDGKPLDRRDHR